MPRVQLVSDRRDGRYLFADQQATLVEVVPEYEALIVRDTRPDRPVVLELQPRGYVRVHSAQEVSLPVSTPTWWSRLWHA